MLLEWLEFSGELRLLHVALGALIGLVFGAAAQISRFCIRRAIAADGSDGRQAGAVWLTALGVAVASFAVAFAIGFADLSEHRFWSPELPVLAIVAGGFMFGAGMILTRGCISRLTVLSATGNLRAALVLVVFAVLAHATLKGVLAPARVAIGSLTVDAPMGSLFAIPSLGYAVAAITLLAAIALVARATPKPRDVALGAVIGLMPLLGWVGTGALLYDEFDPLPVQSIAFTLPFTDSLFWVVASSAIPASFGVGLIGGVLAGSFLSAAARGELAWQSFESPRQTGRYMAGAALMGVGGVLAGGCTVGAGLSGASSLSLAAILALASIIAGGWLTNRAFNRAPIAVPAE